MSGNTEEDCDCPECVQAIAPWMATFADLMSLLMCFFVLLLSFSEMDVQSYKRMAGSMKAAFGVQREIQVEDPPKATSIIAQEFSPGKPDPTILKIIQQQATTESEVEVDADSAAQQMMADFVEMLQEEFDAEIESEALEVWLGDSKVKITLNEKATFPSGSAKLQRSFKPALEKMGKLLNETKGRIMVAGHTDNVPIRTRAFPSNWELSAARAASVVHLMSESGLEDTSRLEIRAFADTLPLRANDSAENRAANRRVEIIIGEDSSSDPYAELRDLMEEVQSGQ